MGVINLAPSLPRRFAWRPIRPSRPRAGRRSRPSARPDPPDASPGPPEHKVELFSCTTSVQLKIINERTGGRKPAKTANQGVVVVYIDRARGYTM